MRSNKQATNPDCDLHERNTVFIRVNDTRTGHTEMTVELYLLLGSVSCPGTIQQPGNELRVGVCIRCVTVCVRCVTVCVLCVTEHLSWSWFKRNRTRELIASLDALGPCVIKLHGADISAFLEPSTAMGATAVFAGFLNNTALVTPAVAAYNGSKRCCRCFYQATRIHTCQKRKPKRMPQHNLTTDTCFKWRG